METIASKIMIILKELEETTNIIGKNSHSNHHFFCQNDLLLLSLSYELINQLKGKRINVFLEGFNPHIWTKGILSYISKVSTKNLKAKIFKDSDLRSISKAVQYLSESEIFIDSYSREISPQLILDSEHRLDTGTENESVSIFLNFSNLKYSDEFISEISNLNQQAFIFENLNFNTYKVDHYDYLYPHYAPKEISVHDTLNIVLDEETIDLKVDDGYPLYYE
jgi:hypothetical protein